MRRLDPRSLLVWLAASLTVVLIADNPAVHATVLLSAGVVALSAGGPSPFRGFLLLGVTLVAVRTALFALTGHTGETAVLQLPILRLPAVLGGLTIGGAVTAEVLLSGLADGLRIVAVLACIGAFLAVTETIEIIRLVPRFLFEAALVVNIAMAFTPGLARAARDMREAQRMRGGRARGFRAITPIVVPLLATALERSVALAESMDSRGYGRTARGAGAHRLYRLTAALSAVVCTASGSVWAMGRLPLLSGAAALVSGAVLAASLRALSRLVPRTRYKKGRWERVDWIVVAAAAAALIGVGLTAGEIIRFDPYRAMEIPPPHPAATLAALMLAAPALAASRRKTA